MKSSKLSIAVEASDAIKKELESQRDPISQALPRLPSQEGVLTLTHIGWNQHLHHFEVFEVYDTIAMSERWD